MLGYREGSSDQAPISMPVTWSGNSGAWVMTWTENNYNKWYDSDEDEVYYYGDSALNGRGKDYGYIAIV